MAKLWQIHWLRRRLSEDEMNRGIGMLEAGRLQRHVANVLGVSYSVVARMIMELIPNDWKCLTGPHRKSGTLYDSSPGPINCPSGQVPMDLECYDLT